MASTPPPPQAKQPYSLPPDAVFFITGCSSGLGLALAQLIASHPTHRLVATARNPSSASHLEESLLQLASASTKTTNPTTTKGLPPPPPPPPSKILILPLDVTSPSSITTALATTLSHPGFGRVDVLVNNAGYGLSGDTESSVLSEADQAKARAVVDTNFWGVANLTLHAMRIMREDNAAQRQQRGGLIVQVSSMGGFMGFPGNAYYHAAKFAVEGFTESVSREVRPEWNIHFTIAEPSGIDTKYATSSIVKLTNHPAYDAPDSPGRMLVGHVDNPEFRKSWTKPEAMARAIYEVVSSGKQIPMRFPLGRMAWEVLRAEVDAVAKEFDEMKELSVGVDTNEHGKHVETVQSFA